MHYVPKVALNTSLQGEGILLFDYRPAVVIDEIDEVNGLSEEMNAEVKEVFKAIEVHAQGSPVREAIEYYNFWDRH